MSKIENRSDIINALIESNKYTRYLEIGVRDNKNFNRINTKCKDGVDPKGKCSYKMTSDKFFAQIPKDKTYDIVFVDGMHTKEQVLKDIDNSLKHLSKNGTIVLHDCNPQKAEHAIPKYKGWGTWNGTVYLGLWKLRATRKDLDIRVVDLDTGCGIIRRGSQEIYPKKPTNFKDFENNRKDILNLISVSEFLDIYM